MFRFVIAFNLFLAFSVAGESSEGRWIPKGYSICNPESTTGIAITGTFSLSPNGETLLFKSGKKLKLKVIAENEEFRLFEINGGFSGTLLNKNRICGPTQVASFIRLPKHIGEATFFYDKIVPPIKPQGNKELNVCMTSEYTCEGTIQ